MYCNIFYERTGVGVYSEYSQANWWKQKPVYTLALQDQICPSLVQAML